MNRRGFFARCARAALSAAAMMYCPQLLIQEAAWKKRWTNMWTVTWGDPVYAPFPGVERMAEGMLAVLPEPRAWFSLGEA